MHKHLRTLEWKHHGQDANAIDYALPAFHDQEVPVQPFDAMSHSGALFNLRKFMLLPGVQLLQACMEKHPAFMDSKLRYSHGLLKLIC